MTLLQALQLASTIAFAALGVLTARDWLRHIDRRHGYLALALGALSLVTIAGQVSAYTGYRSEWMSAGEVVAFQLSGLGLILFRHSFIHVPLYGRLVAIAALAGTGGVLIYTGSPPPGSRPDPIQLAAAVALVLVWSICVAEPSARLFWAARDRPVVQRRRLRALAYGYLGIVAILLLSLIPRASIDMTAQISLSVAALLVAPVLYVSFAPPAWLRRFWRAPEEERYRQAVNELLLFAPSRAELAERSLEFATRLVGAASAFIVDGDGKILASRGVDMETAGVRARELVPGGVPDSSPRVVRSGTIITPLTLDSGTGFMIAVGGPFTPIFGDEEVERLRQYSAAVTAALDRVRVSERMAALEEVKGRFLRIASHELRGPLALVKGYISMLQDQTLPPEALDRILPLLATRLDHMSQMLNQMLETSRLEDDRMAVDLKRFDLREAVNEVLGAMVPLAGSSHLISVTAPSDPVEVIADRPKVELIVSNLIDNAIKYSPRGGPVHCRVAARDGTAIVSVKDSGVGISAEDMGVLFTRFGRIANDETTAVPGTGLGLYLSRELARLQKGDITVSSEPGLGSTFTVELPIAR